MSIKLMSLMWDIPFPSQSALLVALKMADYSDDDGNKIHPSREKLAKHAQISLSGVKRILKCFRDINLLEVVEQGGQGPKSTTLYKLNLQVMMQLHDGYLKLVGTNDAMEIVANESTEPVDTSENKGATQGPFLSTSGPNEKISGSHGEPQYTNLEPPIKRGACAPEKFDLGKSGGALPAIPLSPTDVSWGPWIDWLHEHGQGELAVKALTVSKMVVAARWPRDGIPLPKVPRPKAETLTDRSKAMAGEGAE